MELASTATPPVIAATVFHAHQFAEKLLKCVMYANRQRPPHGHETAKLLEECPQEMRSDGVLARACAFLDGIYPSSRYGHVFPTPQNARDAVAAARVVRERVMPIIERLQRES